MAPKWYNKATVQVAIVTTLGVIIVVLIPICFQVPKLKSDNENLKQSLQTKEAEIQRLETLLTPFRTIALERYTAPESEALRKLASDMNRVQQDLQDKSDTIKTLTSRVQTLDPFKQAIRTASAVVEVHVDTDVGPGAFIDGTMRASLGFGKGTQPLLVLRNKDAQWSTKKISDSEWALSFEAHKDLTENFGDWTLETLSDADNLLIFFNRIPTNHWVVGGSVTCTFNGSILRNFTIPRQEGKHYVNASIPKGSLIKRE
jgi:prefoldin subunit 5